MNIERISQVRSVALANGQTISSAFSLVGLAAGVVNIPLAFSGTQLSIYHSETETGTFVPLYDEAGAAVKISGLSGLMPCAAWIPPQAFASPWIKLVSGTSQSGAIVLTLSLAS